MSQDPPLFLWTAGLIPALAVQTWLVTAEPPDLGWLCVPLPSLAAAGFAEPPEAAPGSSCPHSQQKLLLTGVGDSPELLLLPRGLLDPRPTFPTVKGKTQQLLGQQIPLQGDRRRHRDDPPRSGESC